MPAITLASTLALATLAGLIDQPAEAQPAADLPTGWRWVIEPAPLRDYWRSNGYARFHEGGALLLDPGPGDTAVARLVLTDPVGGVGAAKPNYEVVLLDPEGREIDASGWGSQSNGQMILKRMPFEIEGGADNVGSIGLRVLDLEGRKARAAEARAKAEGTGATALPLPVVGEPYAFDLPTIDAGRVRSEDLKGKVVLIDCWATWCGPCMAKMPELKALEDKYDDKGLVVIGVTFDDEKEPALKAIDEKGLDWTHVHANSTDEGYDGDLWSDMTGIESIPRLLLIDRDGVLRHDFYPHDIVEKVEALIDEGGDA